MILPATKSHDLVVEINQALNSARSYVSKDEFLFKRIHADATKLLKVNAKEGRNVLAQLYSLVGDAEEAIYHIDVALKLSDDPLLWRNKAGMLSNLGLYSEAQKAFKKAAFPEQGFFSENLGLGMCIGAFHTLLELETAALRMKLDVDRPRLEFVRRVVSIMNDSGTTDSDLGAVLDVAGKILRERRLFYMGDGPDIVVWDQDALERHVAISIRIPVPNKLALILDRELGHRLYDAITHVPFQIMLHFESGRPQNEHFAEQSTSII